LAVLVTSLGLGGQRESARVLRERALCGAEAVGEDDMARTDDIAAPALDAVVEPESLQSVEIPGSRRGEDLLRLKAWRARRRAVAAANARPLLVALAHLAVRRREDAARRLRDRNIVGRQCEPHQAAAVDQAHDILAVAAALLDEIPDRRADRRLDVARPDDAAAGHRHDPRRHGLPASGEP